MVAQSWEKTDVCEEWSRNCSKGSRVVTKPRQATTIVEVVVVLGIIAVLMALIVPAVQRARDAAFRVKCQTNLKQLGLSLVNYHDEHGKLPPGCGVDSRSDPYPFMSWCTRLLPYLEQASLWQRAQAAYSATRNSAYCPPHIGDQVQPAFLCPSESREVYDGPFWKQAFTHYLGVEGTNQTAKDGLLYLDSRVGFAAILDGTSNTLMVGERPPGVITSHVYLGYWYAGRGQDRDGSANMILGVREWPTSPFLSDCKGESNRFQQGRRDHPCDALHFWSVHGGGAHFNFADGSVRFVSYSADGILPALATRAGGEAVVMPH